MFLCKCVISDISFARSKHTLPVDWQNTAAAPHHPALLKRCMDTLDMIVVASSVDVNRNRFSILVLFVAESGCHHREEEGKKGE